MGANRLQIRRDPGRVPEHKRQLLRGEDRPDAGPAEKIREARLQPPVLVAQRTVHRPGGARLERRRLSGVRRHARIFGHEHDRSFPNVGRGVGPDGTLRRHRGFVLEDQG